MLKNTYSLLLVGLLALTSAIIIPTAGNSQTRSGLSYIIVPYDEKSTVRRFKRDSSDGKHAASLILANYYINGIYVEHDVDEGIRLFRSAAEAGYPQAQIMFAQYQLGRRAVLVEPEEAFNWLQRAAEQEFPPAYAMLAEFYRAGIVGPVDMVLAIENLKIAANKPLLDISKKPRKLKQFAKYRLDRHPYSYPVGNFDVMNLGNGGVQLVGKMSREIKLYSSRFRGLYDAMEYYDKIAVNQSILDAQYFLGMTYDRGMGVERDLEQAFNWYLKAADQGHNQGVLSVGWFYENGFYVEKSYQRAMEYYKNGSEFDNAQATANVGHLYDQGFGVEKNDKEAVKWFKKALDLDENVVTALRSLGLKLIMGQGVRKDEKKGFGYMLNAANRDDMLAMGNIGVMYLNGIYLEKDVDAGVEWYEKAAKLGHVQTMNRLGVLYENDKFDKKDLLKSYMWHSLAAERGDTNSSDFLPKLEEYLSPEQVEQGKKLVEDWIGSW